MGGKPGSWKSWPFVALVLALVAIATAAFLAHLWGDEGLDPLYLVAFLAVIGLSFEGTRRWLERATNVKLPGGFEVARQVEDAVAQAAELPDVDEERDETTGEERLRVLDSDWWQEPEAAMEKLRSELRKRLTWIERELFAANHRRPTALIARLEDERLIKRFEARIAAAVLEVSGAVVARELRRDDDRREVAVRFVETADTVVYQLRLIAFDNAVRQGLNDRGLRILDIRGQPKGRWPDFYAFHPEHQEEPLRISVRMARTKASNLIDRARRRLGKPAAETPLDDLARNLIVFPQTSKTKPGPGPIPAVKRVDFFAWIDRGMPAVEFQNLGDAD